MGADLVPEEVAALDLVVEVVGVEGVVGLAGEAVDEEVEEVILVEEVVDIPEVNLAWVEVVVDGAGIDATGSTSFRIGTFRTRKSIQVTMS